ncbi:MAG: PTS sugar transporter subunit IIA [Phycisphaerales bacterium]|nr:PTS sugar transporter subunit IIA [Phycisphaerales bacterium]
MLINRCLASENIELCETVQDRNQAIATLSHNLAVFLKCDRSAIEQAALVREKARTTAFANGAAIPHCRLPGLRDFGMALMILRQPVDWDSEGHKVDIIAMITGPSHNVSAHLRILANCSQLLDSLSLRDKLKTAPSPKAAYDLVCTAEEAIERRRAEHGMLRELHSDHANGGDYLREVTDQFKW